MLTVLALERGDGWAFVGDGNQIFFVRPPYRQTGTCVAEATVARAVTEHGFSPCDRAFQGWAEVIAFLRDAMVQHRKEQGPEIPEHGAGRALLRHAPPSAIVRILDRVETELLPGREFSTAEDMLLAILQESPRAQADAELRKRAIDLLADVKEKRKCASEALMNDESRFPKLARCGKLAASKQLGRRIASAGSFFAG